MVVYDPEDPLKQYYDVDNGVLCRYMMTRILLMIVTE